MEKAIQSLLLIVLVASSPLVLAQAPPAAPGATQAQPGPQELIQQVSHALLKELSANREAFRKDPAKLRALVDKHLLPHFDTDYAARLVLGKHWTTATPEQRQRFINAFIQSMMGNYGDAILDFTADRLRFLPFKGDPAAKSATVRSEVKRSDGTPVPVNYSMRMTPQGWKAWDVTIEGISYVKNFKTDFGAEIDQKGLDALIQRLESQQQTVAEAKP